MRTLALMLALCSTTTLTSLAFADAADKAACANLKEDDACTRGDGRPGTCVPDESDPGVLTCDDDAGGGGGGGGDDDGCSAAGSSSTGGGAVIPLLLAAVGVALSRRARPLAVR